jgi:hypothetical protein
VTANLSDDYAGGQSFDLYFSEAGEQALGIWTKAYYRRKKVVSTMSMYFYFQLSTIAIFE